MYSWCLYYVRRIVLKSCLPFHWIQAFTIIVYLCLFPYRVVFPFKRPAYFLVEGHINQLTTTQGMIYASILGVVGAWFTRESDKAVIDDAPFQLQYIWTTTFLFISSVLISMNELIGNYRYVNNLGLNGYTYSYNSI